MYNTSSRITQLENQSSRIDVQTYAGTIILNTVSALKCHNHRWSSLIIAVLRSENSSTKNIPLVLFLLIVRIIVLLTSNGLLLDNAVPPRQEVTVEH